MVFVKICLVYTRFVLLFEYYLQGRYFKSIEFKVWHRCKNIKETDAQPVNDGERWGIGTVNPKRIDTGPSLLTRKKFNAHNNFVG